MRALITGASSGIGRALAFEAARAGYELILSARRSAELADLAEEIRRTSGVKVHCLTADLSNSAEVRGLADRVKALGPLDVLINNAGFGLYNEFKDSELDPLLNMLQLNVSALTALCKLLLPDLIQRRGKIMNVASTAAFQPGPYMAAYYASKSYVLSFSEAIAEELAPLGVTVTALCPGPTRSEFQERAAMRKSALVANRTLPSSEAVAAYGFKAMQRGQRVAIHGSLNWLMAQSIRFTPRALVLKLVKFLSRPSP